MGNDVGALKRILNDSSYAPFFEENKRTLKQLSARWDVIREHISRGKTLDALVQEEMNQPDDDNNAGDEDEVRF